jgi:hypothetical protein
VSAAPPLSHHALLDLVAPFAPDGWRLDLQASDRAARRLAFQPRRLPADPAAGTPELELRLWMEPDDGSFTWRLVRESRVVEPDVPAASAVSVAAVRHLTAVTEALGDDVAELWARVRSLPPSRQWPRCEGAVAVALVHRVTGPAESPVALLRGAEALLPAGLRWRFTVSGVSGYPAEHVLEPLQGAPAPPRRLPDDLLTVRHRAWNRLTATRLGWQGSVAVKGEGAARSDDALARLREGLAHLGRTFAEPPPRFHERHRASRWAEALRRTGPLALGVAIVGVALWLGRDSEGNASALGALANLVPPLLMGLFFMRREMPRLDWPRPPRRVRETDWTPAPLATSPSTPPAASPVPVLPESSR